ncbi:MAG: hypothetical protein K6C13_09605 [Oscillospiraceae bacterium]|nr:hypothetical protein [Oscillospiraceae bacterium]
MQKKRIVEIYGSRNGLIEKAVFYLNDDPGSISARKLEEAIKENTPLLRYSDAKIKKSRRHLFLSAAVIYCSLLLETAAAALIFFCILSVTNV